jgi:hypothetical protein
MEKPKVIKKIQETLKGIKKRSCLKKPSKLILVNAYDEYCFWVCDGGVIKNLKELKVAFKKMNDKTFAYHVSKDKNDFAKWIKEVLKDEVLAKSLQKTKTRKMSLKKIEIALKKYKK